MLYLARSVCVALAATIGDFVWFETAMPHTLLHGGLRAAGLFLVVGLVLGQPRGAWVRGASGALASGAAAAGLLYAMGDWPGGTVALITAWGFVWVALAAVGAWVSGSLGVPRRWVGAGLIAAVASGLSFYLVSAVWAGHAPGDGRNYFWHLVAWTIAWAPGMTALTWNRIQR